MTGRTIIVAGLGRCGTTLVMRMLAAGGVPTVGSAPDWEDVVAQHKLDTDPAAWRRLVHGKAVKVLDAHRYRMPVMPDFGLLWLQRDYTEQAKSQLKLIASMFSNVDTGRAAVRAMAASNRRDTPRALRSLEERGAARPSLAMRFERLIDEPLVCAQILCAAFDLPRDRAEAMAACVIPRDSDCLPYLLENSLV